MSRTTTENWQAWNEGGNVDNVDADLSNPHVYRARIAALKSLALKLAVDQGDIESATDTNSQIRDLRKQYGLTDYELYGIGVAYEKIVASYAIHGGDLAKVNDDIYSWLPDQQGEEDIFPILRPEEVMASAAYDLYLCALADEGAKAELHQDAINWLQQEQAVATELGRQELADIYGGQLDILVQ